MANFVELLLTALQYQAEGLLKFADIILATPAESRRYFHRVPSYERRWFKTDWARTYHNRQQFYKALNQLKRQELVVKKGARGETRWALTKRGLARMEQYRKLRKDPFSSRSANFSRPIGEGMTIVSYDISEKERKRRDWVRVCLTVMGFKKLQKSVWIAQGRIDEDFIHALRERNLLDNIHIFAVAKEGTVRRGFAGIGTT